MNMFSQLAGGFMEFLSQWWLIIMLIILLIVMYVVSFKRRKAYNEQMEQMLNSLRPGDNVKTVGGFYGKIVSIKETTEGKVVLLEMGEGSKVSYMSIDANAIYGIDQKQDIVYDKDGNVIPPKGDVKREINKQTSQSSTKYSDSVIENQSLETEKKFDAKNSKKDAEKFDETSEDNTKEEKAGKTKKSEKEKNKPLNEDESKLEDIEKLISGK